MINIGEPTTRKSMLGSFFCRFKGHDWNPEDFNEFTTDMDVGDEAILRCKRCNIKIVTIEKRQNDLKWTPHIEEATLYEVTDKGKKLLDTENLKEGAKKDFDKFQENFK